MSPGGGDVITRANSGVEKLMVRELRWGYNAVFYDRMRSCVGRNVQLCCERFSMTLADATSSLFSVRAIDDMCIVQG